MITVLNQKRLLLDTDPQELARVKETLKRHNIEFYVKTTVSDNVLSRSFNAKAAERLVRTYSTMETQTYVYYLYVRRRDYARAKQAAYGK